MPRFKGGKLSKEVEDVLTHIQLIAIQNPFKARNMLKKVVKVMPECIEAHMMLGELYISEIISNAEGEEAKGKGRKEFETVLSLSKDTEAPASVYLNLAAMCEGEESISYYKRGIFAATEELKTARSKSKSKSVKRLKHEIVSAYMSLAETYENCNMGEEERKSEVGKCFTAALGISPDDSTVLQTQARFILNRARSLSRSLSDGKMSSGEREKIEGEISKMRDEAKELIEKSCEKWVDRIDELMDHGLSLLSVLFLFTFFFSYFLHIFFFFFLILLSLAVFSG